MNVEETITVTIRLRGTEKETERVKARIASISACEEVISMYVKQTKRETVEEKLYKYSPSLAKRLKEKE